VFGVFKLGTGTNQLPMSTRRRYLGESRIDGQKLIQRASGQPPLVAPYVALGASMNVGQ